MESDDQQQQQQLTAEDVEKMQEPQFVEVTDQSEEEAPEQQQILVQGESASEEFITIIRAEETQKIFQSNFLENLFDLYLEGSFNDVHVRCHNEERIPVPGCLLYTSPSPRDS